MTQLETMYWKVDQHVATITLNRPRVLNCVNMQFTQDLRAIVDCLTGSENVRVVVLRGEGRAFCSGIDATALSRGDIPEIFFRQWEEVLRKLETMDAVVVAAVHSYCIGGGLQLALACDLCIARDDARMGVTAVKEGIIPGMGMWRLARHAGLGRAKRMALTADIVDAKTALEWGLCEYVASAGDFESQIVQLTERLVSMAWTSTRLTKRLANLAPHTSWGALVDVFSEYQRQSILSDEHREAMAEHRESMSRRHAPPPVVRRSN